MASSLPALDVMTRRVKEQARRERLHRQIRAVEAKLYKLGNPSTMLQRERVWRLTSKLKRLRWQLAQPELFL